MTIVISARGTMLTPMMTARRPAFDAEGRERAAFECRRHHRHAQR